MNKDEKVIEEFGEEWARYSYDNIDEEKLYENFQQYFGVFPWQLISDRSEGFDMGCGSGRWAKFVAPKVKMLNCIEPSKAIEVAKKNLRSCSNVNFFQESTDTCLIESSSQDFGYCLGVLHHVPNTQEAISDCARLLKPNAPFLLYLYYNLENEPLWFKAIWKASDYIRKSISKLPSGPKKLSCEVIALLIYLPLSRTALAIEKIGFDVSNIPLSDYRRKPYYQLRNDALDRFGTRLEQRFSREEIKNMLKTSGFDRIEFSENTPFWCCVAYKS